MFIDSQKRGSPGKVVLFWIGRDSCWVSGKEAWVLLLQTYTLNRAQALSGVMPGRDPSILFRSRKESPQPPGDFVVWRASLAPVLCLPLRHADVFLYAQPVLTLPGPCTVVGGGLLGSRVLITPWGAEHGERPPVPSSPSWLLASPPFSSHACLHWYYLMALTSTCPAHASFINSLSSY